MKGLEKVLKYAAICLICLMCLIPFYVLLVLALNSPQRVFFEGNIFIPDFYWQNFLDAWRKSKIGTAMLNSAIITAGTLILTIITGGLAGYAIARHNTKYNKFVFGLLLSCMMIPGIINTVPLYTLMRKNSCGKYPLGNDSGLLHTGNAVCGVHLRNIYKSAAKRIGRSGCVRWLHRVQRFLESYFPDYKTRNGILRDSERLWYLEQLCAGYVLLAVEGKAEHPAGIVRLFPAVWRW